MNNAEYINIQCGLKAEVLHGKLSYNSARKVQAAIRFPELIVAQKVGQLVSSRLGQFGATAGHSASLPAPRRCCSVTNEINVLAWNAVLYISPETKLFLCHFPQLPFFCTFSFIPSFPSVFLSFTLILLHEPEGHCRYGVPFNVPTPTVFIIPHKGCV